LGMGQFQVKARHMTMVPDWIQTMHFKACEVQFIYTIFTTN
jgi:hypothetical protein